MNNETFDSVVGADVAYAILVCPIVAIALVFFIIVVLLVVYTKRDQRSPLTESSKVTMLSLAVINASYTCFVLVMGVYAIKNRSQQLYIYTQSR